MALTLQDMDNYTLGDLDFLTLEQLETMNPQDLIAAVEAVRKIAESSCNPETVLNDNQRIYVINIIHEHKALFNNIFGNEIAFVPKQITAALALLGVKRIADVALDYIISHQEEIRTTLIQCYNFLKELLS